MSRTRTLNVKRTSRAELKEKWGFPMAIAMTEPIFIRCNAAGEVNWDKAPVYSKDEISEREKVNIHDNQLDIIAGTNFTAEEFKRRPDETEFEWAQRIVYGNTSNLRVTD